LINHQWNHYYHIVVTVSIFNSISDNDFSDECGCLIAKELVFHLSLTELYLGGVHLDEASSSFLKLLPPLSTFLTSPAVPSSIVTSDVGRQIFSAFSTNVPSEVTSKGWIDLFKFWRQGDFVDLRQCRVMIVGNKEVGKTSLVRALTNKETCLAPHIRERTQGIDVNIQRLEFLDSGLVCSLWDFAGQEIYYLSHSIHFSRRCIFCLVWSHVYT